MSRRAFSLLLALWLLALGSTAARAEEPVPARVAGTAPAPLNNAGTVVLVSQTVDAAIHEAEDGSVYADVGAATKVHNTDKYQNARALVGWPFWAGGALRFDPAALPGFAVTRDGAPIASSQQTFAAAFSGETRPDTLWLVSELVLGRDERAALQANWRQPLAPAGSPLVTFDYGLLPAGAWAAPIGSARITVKLDGLSSEEQIIRAIPANPSFLGTAVEWLLVDEEPAANISVTFVTPSVWREIEAARATLLTDPANLGTHLHLAGLYQRLADAGAEEYRAQAEATLVAARDAAPGNPEPHWYLAEFYGRLIGPPENPDLRYLELTAHSYEAALEAGLDGDRAATARARATSHFQLLSDLWAARENAAALEYLNHAQRWADDAAAAALGEQRQAIIIQTALETLERDGIDAAVAFAERNGLPGYPGARPPFAGVDVRVETGPDGRAVVAVLTGEATRVTAAVNDLRARLSGVPNVVTEWQLGPQGATVHLRWGEGQEPRQWAETGAALAGVLPETAEYDLLRSALGPLTLAYDVTLDGLTQQLDYREHLALTTRAEDVAYSVREQAEDAPDEWQRALLTSYAEEWERFAGSQSATYAVTFNAEQGKPLRRQWQPSIPTTETLSYSAAPPRLTSWLRLGATLLVGLFAAMALIWRWPVYR